MKKLLVGFLVLGSFSVFANHYDKIQFQCETYADSSTISERNKNYTEKKTFVIDITTIEGTKKIVRIEQSDRSILELPKIELNNEYSGKISYGSLSKAESKKILEGLGINNVPSLPKGFSFPTVKKSFGNIFFITSQVHFKPSKNDGLSYHLHIKCDTLDSRYEQSWIDLN